jgi:DNA-binding transcriptional ArsR family regulator
MNSRWSKNRGSKNIRPDVPGDREILKLLARHSPLTNKQFAAATGRSYSAIVHRTDPLKREPYELITVHATQLSQSTLYQHAPQAFHLTKKGEAKLRELGIEPKARSSNHFNHALAQAEASLSFEIGARMLGMEYEVLDTKEIVVNGHKVIPDLGPIGLGRNGYWRFTFVEVDMGSEPISSENKHRQQIQQKFAAYVAFLRQDLYQTIFGIPNATILFTTTTKGRMESMIALLNSMTADYVHRFRFFVLPAPMSGASLPSGWAVTSCGLAPEEN